MSTGPELTNYYAELSLPRSGDLEEINFTLRRLKKEWSSRATRNDDLGKQARNFILLIEEASQVFKSEESRKVYDSKLNNPEVPDAKDWLKIAWDYYLEEDFSSSRVAVQKARSGQSENSEVFVLSALIELHYENLDRAEDYINEAFVLKQVAGESLFPALYVKSLVFQQMILSSKNKEVSTLCKNALDVTKSALKVFDNHFDDENKGVHIHVIRASIFEIQEKWDDCFFECKEALSLNSWLGVEAGIEQLLYKATNKIAWKESVSKLALKVYNLKKRDIENSDIDIEVRVKFKNKVNSAIDRTKELIRSENQFNKFLNELEELESLGEGLRREKDRDYSEFSKDKNKYIKKNFFVVKWVSIKTFVAVLLCNVMVLVFGLANNLSIEALTGTLFGTTLLVFFITPKLLLLIQKRKFQLLESSFNKRDSARQARIQENEQLISSAKDKIVSLREEMSRTRSQIESSFIHG